MKNRTILVVDDEPDIRDALREILADEGYTVAEAANGAEALAHLRSNPTPFLVLLDLMMPVLNGYQFLEAVANDPKLRALSVLLISAAAREQVELAARSSAVAGVLMKPLELDSLLATIEKLG